MPIRRDFKLYLNAGRSIPLVINASQYDRGEQWYFTLYSETGEQYYPDSAAIVGTKADGNLIANAAEADSRGYVIVTETEQMTAAAGKNKFELLIDDQTHGTANFVLLVEPSPADEGVPSESDLSLIQQAIDGTSATAIAAGVAAWMSEHLTPTTPVVDQSLTVQGAAADSAKVGQEISDLKSQITQLEAIPRSVKLAMDTLFQNMAVRNDDVYTDEYATFHAWASAINVLSISAVFAQGDNLIFNIDSLESLREYLTVTAYYDDGTSAEITSYTLSGELTAGDSTITVSYENKTTTFVVHVTEGVDIAPALSSFVANGAPVRAVYDSSNNALRVYTTSNGTYRGANGDITLEKGYSYKISVDVEYTSGNGRCYLQDKTSNTSFGGTDAITHSGTFTRIVKPSDSASWSDSTSPNSRLALTVTWGTSMAGDITFSNLHVIKFMAEGDSE